MTKRSFLSDPAARAISRLLSIRDALEFAGRSPGDRVEISRQVLESLIDDAGVTARLICEMEED